MRGYEEGGGCGGCLGEKTGTVDGMCGWVVVARVDFHERTIKGFVEGQ